MSNMELKIMNGLCITSMQNRWCDEKQFEQIVEMPEKKLIR